MLFPKIENLKIHSLLLIILALVALISGQAIAANLSFARLDQDLASLISNQRSGTVDRIDAWYSEHLNQLSPEQVKALQTRQSLSKALDQLAASHYLSNLTRQEKPSADAVNLLADILATLQSTIKQEANVGQANHLASIVTAVDRLYLSPLRRYSKHARLRALSQAGREELVAQYFSVPEDQNKISVFDLTLAASPPQLQWTIQDYYPSAKGKVHYDFSAYTAYTSTLKPSSNILLYADLSHMRNPDNIFRQARAYQARLSKPPSIALNNIQARIDSCVEQELEQLRFRLEYEDQLRRQEEEKASSQSRQEEKSSFIDVVPKLFRQGEDRDQSWLPPALAHAADDKRELCSDNIRNSQPHGVAVIVDVYRGIVIRSLNTNSLTLPQFTTLLDEAAYLTETWPTPR